MLLLYDNLVKSGKIISSCYQLSIIKSILQIDKYNSSFYRKFLRKKSIYIYGEVGLGKSLIMSLYFQFYKEKKLYFHYHDFISQVHEYINNRKLTIIEYVKLNFSDINLVCIDEVHINDIVDAMIIKDFIITAVDSGIFIFFTSNYHPSKLYVNNINSESFFPALCYINKYFDVINIIGDDDYRKLNSNTNNFFYNNYNVISLLKKRGFNFDNIFFDKLEYFGLNIVFEVIDNQLLKIDFDYLCNNNFGRDIYKLLIERYNYLFLENLYEIKDINILKRFIIFIDQCYEKKVKLFITSSVPLNSISKIKERDFKRSLSRILELTNSE